MSPLPPTVILAARTAELRGSYLAVYVELYDWLDADEFRTVKAWRVAERLHVDRAQVYRALDLLSRLGFLERGDVHGTAYTYRIVPQPDTQRVA